MSHTLVSLVGFQPGGVAVALKTLVENANIRENQGIEIGSVLLLETSNPRIQAIAQKLKAFADGLGLANRVESLEVAVRPATRSTDAIHAHQIGDWLAGDVACFADPGLNPHIAQITRALPAGTRFIHTDTERLYIATNDPDSYRDYKLSNIGLDTLLGLHDLKHECEGGALNENVRRYMPGKLPAHIVPNIRISTANGRPNTEIFDLGFEMYGRLFVLAVIDQQESPRQSRSSARLQRLRDLVAYRPNGLIPQVAVIAGDALSRGRARTHGWQVIESAGELQNWMQGRLAKPGSSSSADPLPLPAQRTPLRTPARGAGAPANSPAALAVCLGNDPSSTLVSICTHKPKTAFVFYDEDTAQVIEAASRLQQSAAMLPIDHLEFRGTTHIGRNLTKTLQSIAAQLPTNADFRIDISPGTKAQTRVLAAAGVGNFWSLDSADGNARSLDDAPDAMLVRATPFALPDLLTQARVVGGPLVADGDGLDALETIGREALDWLATAIIGHPSQFLNRARDFRDLGEYRFTADGRQIRFEPCPTGRFRFFDGETVIAEGRMPANANESASWFEYVVANSIANAVANDRPPADVRVGIRWQRRDGLADESSDHHDTDIDVAFRFGTRFFAVSCKVRTATDAEADTREIAAAAHTKLGRFTTPLYVNLLATRSSDPENFHDRDDAIQLAAADILNPQRLRKTLDQIARARARTR